MSSSAATATLENVSYEKKGAIAYVTVNRPKVLNALNAKTIAELSAAFEDARHDVAVIVCARGLRFSRCVSG